MTPEEAQKLEPQDRVVYDPDTSWIDMREIDGHTPQVGDIGMVISTTVKMPNAATLECTMTVLWDKEVFLEHTPPRNPFTGLPILPVQPTKQLQSTLPCQYLKRAKNKPSVEFKRKIEALRRSKAIPTDQKGRAIITPHVNVQPEWNKNLDLSGSMTGRFGTTKGGSPLTTEAIEKLMEDLKRGRI